MGLADKLPNGILLTNLERFVNYSRSTLLLTEATAWVIQARRIQPILHCVHRSISLAHDLRGVRWALRRC